MKFTADDALAEYRRLTRELGRFPTPCEFDRLAAMSFSTLRKRVGPLEVVRDVMRGRRGVGNVGADLQAAGSVGEMENAGDGPLTPALSPTGEACERLDVGRGGEGEKSWEEEWLAEEWSRVRVAVAARSSQLRERAEPWGIAWVHEHDWPGAPRKVLSYRESDEVRKVRARVGRLGRSRPKRLFRTTRDEILQAMRVLMERYRDFDQTEFMAVTGITTRDIAMEFPNWAALRREAGMKTARTPVSQRIPDAVLLDAWVELKQKLGRTPAVNDIRRHTRFSHLTYYRRFGRQAEIIRRGEMQEKWRAYVAEMERERRENPEGEWFRLWTTVSDGPPRPSLEEEFAALSVGYALTSRMTKDWDTHPDILVCVQHDWPGYPYWVVEVGEMREVRDEGLRA
jgi:hypothetical protein